MGATRPPSLLIVCRKEPGATVDKTEQAIRRTLAAIDAPLYDIGILSERGMFPRMDALAASQVLCRIPYLKFRNVQGAHIFFRPSGEHRFTVLDDLDRPTVIRLSADGFAPCSLVETSPGNFQVWLKHAQVLSKADGSLAARTLAARYGADPSAADWRRFGRLPGLTNRKPVHRKPDGQFPFVRLTAYSGSVYVKAEAFASEISSLYREQEQQRNALRQSFRPSYHLSSSLSLSRFRNAPRYAGRPAAADMAFAIAACAHGWPESGIAAALTSDYLSRNVSQSRRNAYIRRTLAKAILWAAR